MPAVGAPCTGLPPGNDSQEPGARAAARAGDTAGRCRHRRLLALFRRAGKSLANLTGVTARRTAAAGGGACKTARPAATRCRAAGSPDTAALRRWKVSCAKCKWTRANERAGEEWPLDFGRRFGGVSAAERRD